MKRGYIPFILFAALLMACSFGSLLNPIPATSTPPGNATATGSGPTQSAPPGNATATGSGSTQSAPPGNATATGLGSTLPAPSGNSPGYDQARQFAGQWNGTWNNPSVPDNGLVSATITVNPDGTASSYLDMHGIMLGLAVDPVTISGTYDNNGLTFAGMGVPTFGDLSATFDYNGHLTMTANKVFHPGILKISTDGTSSSTRLQLTWTVTLIDNATEVGTSNLTKP